MTFKMVLNHHNIPKNSHTHQKEVLHLFSALFVEKSNIKIMVNNSGGHLGFMENWRLSTNWILKDFYYVFLLFGAFWSFRGF